MPKTKKRQTSRRDQRNSALLPGKYRSTGCMAGQDVFCAALESRGANRCEWGCIARLSGAAHGDEWQVGCAEARLENRSMMAGVSSFSNPEKARLERAWS